MKFKIVLPLFVLGLCLCSCQKQKQEQVDYVDHTENVYHKIDEEKQNLHKRVEAGSQSQIFKALLRLQELGDWDYVLSTVESSDNLSDTEKAIIHAKDYRLHNDFFKSKDVLNELSEEEKEDPGVQRMFAVLEIEAWKLEDAENRLRSILENNSSDEATKKVLGHCLVLQKKYDQALDLAKSMVDEQPDNAAGYFLESDVYFWDQNPEEAEKFVKKGLQLDPLNADARFFYGYAIWRRIDATQLDDMVAQWEIALKLNPLHFKTHWHLGNGHTNLTFSDYADPNEDEIRKKLEKADSLFTAGELNKALEVTHKVGEAFPKSVLPQMHEASLLYGDFDAKDRLDHLKKAEKLFLDILKRKKHYGPAHNGLAAVIKSERIPYLHDYDSIHKKIEHPEITNMEDLLEVFPDVAYYPGNNVKGMVWNQMYDAVVYFPFLVEQGLTFAIPPLHKDLAIAMHAPYFRFNTTFDNRQWMDIRGVGSGAAGIGYVERGAYGERNVLLHEYTHLYHQQVMTDREKREIRAHYYNAMKNGLTLDYYSQNNEHEYFAQTYPAYFEPEKVHPLDFKSMNATAELKRKDPEMYDFIDKLVQKQEAYLDGDKSAMASNWAQVYINMARKERRSNPKEGYNSLEKALRFDKDYIPTHLTYAQFLIQDKRFEQAAKYIEQAKSLDSEYAPIYIREAKLKEAKDPADIEGQAKLFKKAYELETDLMERSTDSKLLRDFYFGNGMLKESLEAADEYVHSGSTISTYLRDSREENRAFGAWQRSFIQDQGELGILDSLVAKRPFNYILRRRYAEALLANAQDQKALEVLNSAYKDLKASKVNRPDYEVLIALAYQGLEKDGEMKNYIEKAISHSDDGEKLEPGIKYYLARMLISDGSIDQAKRLLKDNPETLSNVDRSDFLITKASMAVQGNEEEKALQLIKEALKYYPYQMKVKQILKQLSSEYQEADKLYNDLIKNGEQI